MYTIFELKRLIMLLKRLILSTPIVLLNVVVLAIYTYSASGTDNEQVIDMLPNVVVIKFNNQPIFKNSKILTDDNDLNDLLIKNNILSLKSVLKKNQIQKLNTATYDLSKIYYGSFSGDKSPLQVSKSLEGNPLIEYAEPKYTQQLYTIPNDSLFHIQKNYFDIIHVPSVWEFVHGENSDIILAVVDAGTDIRHSDLSDNIWSNLQEINGIAGLDDDRNGFIDDFHGWNFAQNSGDPTGIGTMPFNADHGTYISGIVSAISNNKKGISGTSWNATIMPVNAASESKDRVISYGYEGILYAAQNGADVINCSWGSLSKSNFARDILNFANSVGAVVVGAAGNSGSGSEFFPSAYNNVISVTATDSSDQLWESSNFGSFIDLAAPGTAILSTLANERYGYADGTSAAAALVSGSIGLMMVFKPEWNSTQITQQLLLTSDSLYFESRQIHVGRINLYRAITERPVSIQFLGHTYNDANGNQVIENGESVHLNIQIVNHLTPISNATLILTSPSDYITFIKDTITVSSISTLEHFISEESYVFVVDKDIPNKININFNLKIQADGYQKRQNFFLENVIEKTAHHRDASKYIHFQNYPNPFNSTTNIKFRIGKPAYTSIIVYNNRGQKIRTWAKRYYSSGIHLLQWDSKDEFGNPVASGIYYIMIFTKDFKSTKKMILIR